MGGFVVSLLIMYAVLGVIFQYFIMPSLYITMSHTTANFTTVLCVFFNLFVSYFSITINYFFIKNKRDASAWRPRSYVIKDIYLYLFIL